jgi:hypothetical protein
MARWQGLGHGHYGLSRLVRVFMKTEAGNRRFPLRPQVGIPLTGGIRSGNQSFMERQTNARESDRGYFTAPWRKARICARLVLHPELTQRQRYARIAAVLVKDPSVTNRLIGQAIAHFQGRAHQRSLEEGVPKAILGSCGFVGDLRFFSPDRFFQRQAEFHLLELQSGQS